MSTEETSSLRERELRVTVAQLREEVREERNARKREHNERVRELKAARDQEQEASRKTIEELKMKLLREKTQEMTVLQERMTRDFKLQVKEIQRKNEEEKQKLVKELEEKRSFKERKSIEKEVQKQMRQAQEMEQKKTAQEMFTMSIQLSDMEERLRDTQAVDCTKAEVIRGMKAEHQAELESLGHSSRLSSRQQLEELGASQRELREKEREIASNLERIRRLEADKDKLQEEVRRLRRADSWSRASASPPSLTPSTSVGDVSTPPQYTAKEKEMILKNTELSFRVQQLEKKNAELEKYKRELVELLQKAKAEQKPLKESVAKQGVRINSLNASLHDKEKLVKKVTEENEKLIKANSELTHEQAQQKQRLRQQMNQTHTQRMEHQRAVGKYTDLQKQHKKMHGRVKELEQQLRHQHSLPHSIAMAAVGGVASELCSPSVSMTSLASVTEDGDTEHVAAKYREMKGEFVKVKENYKRLKIIYEKLQQKYRLAEQEKLAMESEISQLRASPLEERESPYDMARSSSMLSDNQRHIEALQSRVRELESFVVEQDEMVHTEREEHTRDVSSLTEERDQLQEKLQEVSWKREEGEGKEEEGSAVGGGGERSREQLLEQLSLVEEMNKLASGDVRGAKEKAKELEECNSEMDRTMEGMTLEAEPKGSPGEDEEGEEEGQMVLEGEESVSVLRMARRSVRECQELLVKGQDVSPVVKRLGDLLGADRPPSLLEDTSLVLSPVTSSQLVPVNSSTPTPNSALLAEIGRLKAELSLKEEAVDQAQEKVADVQTLVVELEVRLEEEQKERESFAANWNQEVDTLQAQLSQKESQLKRVRRAIPQGVNEHMHQQLGHKVLQNLQQYKSSVSVLEGSESLLEDLETSLNSLLHTIFPGMFQSPPLLPPITPSSPSATAEVGSPSPTTPHTESHPEATSGVPLSPGLLSAPTDPLVTSALSSRHTTPQSDNETDVTPLSSLSGSPTHSPHQSPEPHPATQDTPPHTPTPPPSPLHKTAAKTTHPHPIEEVMVMRQVECEEISIPLSALFETTPTDSTHHTPPESPVHTSSESTSSTSHSASPDQDIGQLAALHSTPDQDIGQLATQSEEELSHLPSPLPALTVHNKVESEEKEASPEVVAQLDNQLPNSLPHPLTPELTLSGGREYTKEDLDEVELAGSSGDYGPAAAATEEGELGRASWSPPPAGKHSPLPSPLGKSNHLQFLEGNSSLSPSLHYPTPPEAPAARQRVLAQSAAAAAAHTPSPLSRVSGKKRLRTQSMEQEEVREEEQRDKERTKSGRLGRATGERRSEGRSDRLFVAILSYDPEAMCTTGRPDLELPFNEGAIIAVEGSVDDSGFYRGSFQGRTGLVPAGFVQEMEVEDERQRRRLLNQTLTRPQIPSLPSSPLSTPLSVSRPVSGTPSGSQLTHTPLRPLQTTAVPSPPPPSSINVESTRQNNLVIVSWDPPSSTHSSEVTGYHVFANKQLKASVTGPQTRVLLSDVSEVSSVVVGVASHDKDGRQSSVTSTTYHQTTSSQHHQSDQYRLCIVLYDYDPEKMSPSDNPQLELKIVEGNLLRCYTRDDNELSSDFTMAELAESNKRGLVPTDFITEVYGPSVADPNKYEWKSPPESCLPATVKSMLAVYDYNSRQDSPNRGMELEISFKNGDTITVYGSMDSDGFYTGRAGDAFGLVPSNFLQKEKKEEVAVAMQRQQSTEGDRARLGKWELPPNMWQQLNGEVLQLPTLASSHGRTQSDTSGSSGSKKKGSRKQSSGSGSGSSNQEGGAKRKRSHGLFKNPFSRKKSDSAL